MIGVSDIWEAKKRIGGYVHRTPLIGSESIGEIAGAPVFFKCENLQKTGSFKTRGAFNRILSLTKEERSKGVCCYSSGNHAQAVCYAAKILGIDAYVYMPETATPSKVEACRSYGGRITQYGKTGADVYPAAKAFAEKNGIFYVDPVEDPYIMAGQGTAGLEIMEAMPDADTVYVQIGGGGLMTGVATAVKSLSPSVRIIGVEPENMNCMSASLEAGRITKIERRCSIADGLAGDAPGPLAFEGVSRYVDEVITVSDEEIGRATLLLMQRAKMVTEPSGACALAGLLSGKAVKGKKNVCMISGGNVNDAVLAELLSR
ncbi:MAG: pyridoxal-phosphate dependent enzyme [Lachnospiraceae bacterium]|nr:pyridoxal-phosphate dependent enzyme [Lachnospiraceae bacterium]